MKTAMQNLASDVLKLDLSIEDTVKVINLIRLRFEEERQQIVEAYWEGKHNGFHTDDEYYNETYSKND